MTAGSRLDDFEVFAREASTALARQEDRLNEIRRRALQVVSTAGVVFGLFAAARDSRETTWALIAALVTFSVLVTIAIVLQLPGGEWYFVQHISALTTKRGEAIESGQPWNVHEYLAGELERCYECNQPRIDRRLDWMAGSFALLALVVLFLVVDVIICH